jgi:ERCC4-type nuclease
MARHPIPAELKPENIMALIDTREWACHQGEDDYLPVDLSPLAWEKATLQFGDYSARGLESVLCIERKTLQDCIKCVGADRDRFEREMKTLRGYPYRALVIEATWDDILKGNWRGDVTPQQAFGSIMGWSLEVSVVMAGNHANCGLMIARMITLAAKRRCREVRGLFHFLDEPSATEPAKQ